ncbi:actin-like ATPase domain-containing protein [Pseudovirgaria hyperparasitica]|uniref:Phosphotransferase n=1 Tax=Pseudovirgaria hyperparasitica TaxID=470096 RepID=A0A6A6VS88_9PEZI|nr:actin-like ATPase domain-containing protein [Pseudovirgaria hyperparasitica]KAF2752739.1 actin-like ATPase domain-containing protein [Pseudovirgaria hyperparasitica]
MADPQAITYDQTALDEAVRPLTWFLNTTHLHELSTEFTATYRDLAKTSTEHFLATPVTVLPTGLESGRYLAIDVGGTNLRVGIIELLGNIPLQRIAEAEDVSTAKIIKSHDKTWPIVDHLKMDQAEDLFSWIGDCIAEVLTDALSDASDENLFGKELPLGITFSFPLAQTSMNEGILMGMGKGFAIKQGLSLGDLLLDGYSRHCADANGNIHRLPRLKIAAITNDTVATFSALAYATRTTTNSKTTMGLIVGTGCNATIPMKLKYLHDDKRRAAPLPKNFDYEDSKIVINTEWTIRGADEPMKKLGVITSWDDDLSRNSEVPGFQPFEYMTAGRYLGEMVRLAFIDITTRHATSKFEFPPTLLEKNAISTNFLATSVADADPVLLTSVLNSTFPPSHPAFAWSPHHAVLLSRIALAVQARASALVAAAVIGLLGCVEELALDDFNGDRFSREGNPGPGEPKCDMVVAFTGKTMAGYPLYRSTCQHWLDQLVRNGSARNKGKRVVLKAASDGGIIGAAVLAGMMVSRT